ncbi:nucleotide-sugar transmembrane transporter [Aureococcus anophagefferens]|nr:nucleotide-sugar transmembrane transporter [Aureococcus anophagefferens]
MTTVSPKSQEYMGRQRWGSKDGEGLVKDTASSIVREPASVDAPATRQQVVGAVAFYCGCSSTLLFLNKLAARHDGARARAVVVAQIAFATASCYALNAETFIVFRASTPLAVALLDYVFSGGPRRARGAWEPAPDGRVATAYAATDAAVRRRGHRGLLLVPLYFALICFEMTFGKHPCRRSGWASGSPCGSRTCSLPMLWALAWVRGDMAGFFDVLGAMPGSDVVILFLSCVIATLIGYAGWLCRGLVSATSYTLIGVANKLGTVLLAVTFLDNASPSGVAASSSASSRRASTAVPLR